MSHNNLEIEKNRILDEAYIALMDKMEAIMVDLKSADRNDIGLRTMELTMPKMCLLLTEVLERVTGKLRPLADIQRARDLIDSLDSYPPDHLFTVER